MDTITKEITGKPKQRIIKEPGLPFYINAYPYEEKAMKNYLLVKRICDIVVSSVLILTVLSWLYPLLAVLIKLTSKGGTLFIQKRIGLKGKVFNCYKFRTMVESKDADIMETMPNDKRITKIGKWLRFNYIDELPQLINVLTGEMSLIGPRPHMLYHHYKFCAEIPNYDCRHSVKPGITGLSQVKGYHGSIFNPFSIYGRTKLDLFYINKISFTLDIMIFIKTFFIFIHSYRKAK